MNQPQPTERTAKTVPASKEPTKAPWHRPTITFVPLQSTASTPGSFVDGSISDSDTNSP